MSFGNLKRRLQALINRKDLTPELAGSFITDAIADMERQLRIGPMEVLLSSSAWDGVASSFNIPSGYLETIAIHTDTAELEEVSLTEYLRVPQTGQGPTHYHRAAGRFLLRPTPPAGSAVHVLYYTRAPALVSDEDVNVWTAAASNAVLYTAAGLAADFYQMEDTVATRYAARASGYIQAIAEQDLSEKSAGRKSIPPIKDLGDY